MAIIENDYAAYLKTSDGETPLRDLDAQEKIGSLSEDIDNICSYLEYVNVFKEYNASRKLSPTGGTLIDVSGLPLNDNTQIELMILSNDFKFREIQVYLMNEVSDAVLVEHIPYHEEYKDTYTFKCQNKDILRLYMVREEQEEQTGNFSFSVKVTSIETVISKLNHKIESIKNGNKSIYEIFSDLGTKDNNIVILGDSIVAGIGGSNFNGTSSGLITPDDTSGGLICETTDGHGVFYRNSKGYCWANLLKEYLEKNYINTTVLNNGCSGINSYTINKDFDLLVPEDTTKIIMCIGINDRHNGKDYTYTKNNVDEIIQKAIAKNIDICVLTPINPTEKNDTDPVRNYNSYLVANATKLACMDNGIEVGNLQSRLNMYIFEHELSLEELLPDGIHPNDKMYEIMFSVIKTILCV